MDDLISRQAAINKFEPWLKVEGYSEGELNMLKGVLYELRFIPSVPRKGKWIKIMKTNESETATFYTPTWICGDCKTEYDGAIANSIIKFCYNCGADMRGEQDDN